MDSFVLDTQQTERLTHNAFRSAGCSFNALAHERCIFAFDRNRIARKGLLGACAGSGVPHFPSSCPQINDRSQLSGLPSGVDMRWARLDASARNQL
jgi:hypothetical protein